MARVYVPSVSAHLMRRSLGTTVVRITRKASFARASYPGRPSPQGIEYSYHAAGAMARVRARAVYLHGINTLYHAVSVYTQPKIIGLDSILTAVRYRIEELESST